MSNSSVDDLVVACSGCIEPTNQPTNNPAYESTLVSKPINQPTNQPTNNQSRLQIYTGCRQAGVEPQILLVGGVVPTNHLAHQPTHTHLKTVLQVSWWCTPRSCSWLAWCIYFPQEASGQQCEHRKECGTRPGLEGQQGARMLAAAGACRGYQKNQGAHEYRQESATAIQ